MDTVESAIIFPSSMSETTNFLLVFEAEGGKLSRREVKANQFYLVGISSLQILFSYILQPDSDYASSEDFSNYVTNLPIAYRDICNFPDFFLAVDESRR